MPIAPKTLPSHAELYSLRGEFVHDKCAALKQVEAYG